MQDEGPIMCEHGKPLTLVGIIGDAGVAALVGTGERDKRGRDGGATAGDLDLMAARVELGTGVLPGRMKRDDLVADEVVTGLKTRRDGVLVVGRGLHQGGLNWEC